MSVQAMTWALEQTLVKTPTARHVLLCLANYADKHGHAAFPSANSLSADTGLSVRTVRSALEHLREVGAIAPGNQAIAAAYIDRHDRRPVVYDLAMQRGAAAACGTERGAVDACRCEGTGCSSCTNGVQLTQERGAAAAPNPSTNPSLKPKAGRTGAPGAAKYDPVTECPGNVSPSIWAEWCQYRREIRKALTATTVRNQAAALAGHHNPDAVLSQSMANGWTGIFPEKITHDASQPNRPAGDKSAVGQVRAAIAAREAREAAPGPAGQPVAQDDGALRAPLDGEFRRVG
ncbi:helix-turn-helix domain-containing protein [uncultured Pseudomonas sp.]|uniref:helix-turn-helix domain-containing protein n=1 Tax=uncultured Pseudomonas sp. TaxID=114707 RepID=UPI00262B3D75|nr:helix-turn-helix domain-containing protein [uncultured Pseudomonas sp.]